MSNRNTYWKIYRWWSRKGWKKAPYPNSWSEADKKLAEYMYNKREVVNELRR